MANATAGGLVVACAGNSNTRTKCPTEHSGEFVGGQTGSAGQVAVLFARARSVYKSIAGCDVFDVARDARSFGGGLPVVAHPPCRGWGRLRTFARVESGELDLALMAVALVRSCGGVLEHPHASRLWAAAGLPAPGAGRDAYGGWTLPVLQNAWGHRAPKATWLYIVGCDPADLPAMPLTLEYARGRVASMGTAERESTPVGFAYWLFELARRCSAGAA